MNEEVTVQQLDGLIGELFSLREFLDAEKAKLTEHNKKLAELEAKVSGYLKELDRKNYQCPAGTVSLVQKWRVSLPKSVPEKLELFGWLREKGIFDEFVTVNSQSLNSLYLEEWDQAKRKGEGLDFAIPGVPQPTLFETISVRKGK